MQIFIHFNAVLGRGAKDDLQVYPRQISAGLKFYREYIQISLKVFGSEKSKSWLKNKTM